MMSYLDIDCASHHDNIGNQQKFERCCKQKNFFA